MALSQTAQFVLNGLAVLGAFLIGYLFAAFLVNVVDRAVLRRKTPLFVHRSVRVLSGAALAILVAGILFGRGPGWHLFGGGADGGGQTDGQGPPQLINTPVVPQADPPAESHGPRIRVTILGGKDVVAERFYRFGDDPALKNLAELKELVLRPKADPPPVLELRFDSRNALPTDHPAVTMLVRWARSANLGVSFPSDGR